jgi:hypothetical protein
MKPGAEFEITQGSVDLITLFVKSMSGGESKSESAPPASGPAPAAEPATP